MAQYIAHQKSIPSCSSSFQALPKEVKIEMSDLFTIDSFNKTDIVVTTRNTGQKASKHFYCVFCDFCEKEVLPEVLKKYKEYIGKYATLLDLIDEWDALPQVKSDNRSKYVEVIGCFLPNSPEDTCLLPGSSYRKFLERSYEYVKQSHPRTQSKPDSPEYVRCSTSEETHLKHSS